MDTEIEEFNLQHADVLDLFCLKSNLTHKAGCDGPSLKGWESSSDLFGLIDKRYNHVVGVYVRRKDQENHMLLNNTREYLKQDTASRWHGLLTRSKTEKEPNWSCCDNPDNAQAARLDPTPAGINHTLVEDTRGVCVSPRNSYKHKEIATAPAILDTNGEANASYASEFPADDGLKNRRLICRCNSTNQFETLRKLIYHGKYCPYVSQSARAKALKLVSACAYLCGYKSTNYTAHEKCPHYLCSCGIIATAKTLPKKCQCGERERVPYIIDPIKYFLDPLEEPSHQNPDENLDENLRAALGGVSPCNARLLKLMDDSTLAAMIRSALGDCRVSTEPSLETCGDKGMRAASGHVESVYSSPIPIDGQASEEGQLGLPSSMGEEQPPDKGHLSTTEPDLRGVVHTLGRMSGIPKTPGPASALPARLVAHPVPYPYVTPKDIDLDNPYRPSTPLSDFSDKRATLCETASTLDNPAGSKNLLRSNGELSELLSSQRDASTTFPGPSPNTTSLNASPDSNWHNLTITVARSTEDGGFGAAPATSAPSVIGSATINKRKSTSRDGHTQGEPSKKHQCYLTSSLASTSKPSPENVPTLTPTTISIGSWLNDQIIRSPIPEAPTSLRNGKMSPEYCPSEHVEMVLRNVEGDSPNTFSDGITDDPFIEEEPKTPSSERPSTYTSLVDPRYSGAVPFPDNSFVFGLDRGGRRFFSIPHSPSPPQSLLVFDNLLHDIQAYFEQSCQNMNFDHEENLLTPTGDKLENTLCSDFDSYCFTATMLYGKGLTNEFACAISKASACLKQILQAEHPRTLACFLEVFIHLIQSGHLGTARYLCGYIKEIAAEATRTKGPWSQINKLLGQLNVDSVEGMAQIWKCITDILDRELGPSHRLAVSVRLDYMKRVITDPREEEQLLRELVTQLGDDPKPTTPRVMLNLAHNLNRQGRHDEAKDIASKVSNLLQKDGMYTSRVVERIECLKIISRSQYSQKKTVAAEKTMLQAIDMIVEERGVQHPWVTEFKNVLERWLRLWGREEHANTLQREIQESIGEGGEIDEEFD
ncbi:hypothetical protein FDECE_7095 [Fusarium decemcellulare]|nr:hypothetical protein FDECE_7095 [Fusarium decemcellulare]